VKTSVVNVTLGLVVLGIVVGPAHAGEYLQTLKEGSWLCSTPEAYDLAIAEERGQNGSLEDLKQRLLEQKQCIYMDAAFVEKMMVPFARVVERQGHKVKVTFIVEFRKRIEFLHRQISRVTFVGWTDASNLEDKEIL
jgi:hypothetical protein